MKDRELDKDYRQNLVELTQMERELAEFRSRCTQLEEDNQSLEAGLKEVMEALQKTGGQVATPRGSDNSAVCGVERECVYAGRVEV